MLAVAAKSWCVWEQARIRAKELKRVLHKTITALDVYLKKI
jgi:hypothetical protein